MNAFTPVSQITGGWMNALTPVFQVIVRTWNPPPRKMGGQFYWALGDLKFSPAPGGFKILSTFGGGTTRLSLLGGMGGVPFLLVKNLLIPPPSEKVPQ